MEAKISKEQAEYSRGMISSHCGEVFKNDTGYCRHYSGKKTVSQNGSCEIVEGSINPLYWCKYFKRAK